MSALRPFRLAAVAGALALAACGQGDSTSGPGGVTAGEARALDEAAEMIEQRRLPAEALRASETPAVSGGPAPKGP